MVACIQHPQSSCCAFVLTIFVSLQLACLVKSVLAAILKLPEANANIKMVVAELQEVDYTLKNIHAKVKFLPGQVSEETCLRRYTKELSAIREAEMQQAHQQ